MSLGITTLIYRNNEIMMHDISRSVMRITIYLSSYIKMFSILKNQLNVPDIVDKSSVYKFF